MDIRRFLPPRLEGRYWLVVLVSLAIQGMACIPKQAKAPKVQFVESLEPQSDTLPERLELKDVTLGYGDQIRTSVFRHANLNREIRIPASGIIFYPLIGELKVDGLSGMELRRLLTERLDKYIVDPQISLGITVRRRNKIMVLGQVARPGVYAMGEPMRAVEAIARAGFYTDRGNQRAVVLLREVEGGVQTTVLNIDRAVKKGEFAHNPYLKRGDILFVPKTTVTHIDRFAQHLSTWLAPIITGEAGVLLGFNIEREVAGTVFIGG